MKVLKKFKSMKIQACSCDPEMKNNLRKEINRLKSELDAVHDKMNKTCEEYKLCVCELQRKLAISTQDNIKAQTKIKELHLENEHLKATLIVKANTNKKMQAELFSLRKIVKCMGRAVLSPIEINLNVDSVSIPEYDEIVKMLKKRLKVQFASQNSDQSKASVQLSSLGFIISESVQWKGLTVQFAPLTNKSSESIFLKEINY